MKSFSVVSFARVGVVLLLATGAQAQTAATPETPPAPSSTAALPPVDAPPPTASPAPPPAAQPPAVAPAQPPAPEQPAVAPAQPAAAPEEPVADAPAGEPGWAGSRFGVTLSLLGPNSIVGGGLAFQPTRWVELQLWGGYNQASGSRDTGVAHASAEITAATGLARARIWPLERHSVVVDTGLGVTHYSMSASGRGTASSNLGDAIDYQRSGTPMLGILGAGYGYRGNSVFRVAVILGVMLHATKMGDGTVTSSGSFTEADRYDLRVSLDDLGDELTRVRPYLDASVGFLF